MINGWIILVIIFMVGTIVFAILASQEKGIIFAVAMYLSMVLTVVSIATCIAGPLLAKKHILYHESLALTVEVAGPIVGYERFEESVAKSNQWLTDANKKLNTFGIFSMYYGSKIEELEYIVIPEND